MSEFVKHNQIEIWSGKMYDGGFKKRSSGVAGEGSSASQFFFLHEYKSIKKPISLKKPEVTKKKIEKRKWRN